MVNQIYAGTLCRINRAFVDYSISLHADDRTEFLHSLNPGKASVKDVLFALKVTTNMVFVIGPEGIGWIYKSFLIPCEFTLEIKNNSAQ